ncbi:MAG: DEAD/DEAH box helicase [Candidatus Omnitrophota bacterium]
MSHTFKKKLIDLYQGGDNRVSQRFSEKELKDIIHFGAFGEVEENYFLFLYRDSLRSSVIYYGSVLFLNKRDDQERPITIICMEQNGKEQLRSIYVTAALYFLAHDYQNTMTVSGNVVPVFEMAKNKINDYIGRSRQFQTSDPLDEFRFDISHQTVTCTEIETNVSIKPGESRSLKDNLEKLLKLEPEPPEPSPRIPARIGLALAEESVDLSGETLLYFQPVILPLRNDGKPGKPQRVLKSETMLSLYDWIDTPPTLMDFIHRYTFIDSQPGNPRLKITVMNHLFFKTLADEIFSMPEELSFSRWDTKKEFIPLKTFRFRSVDVRFAPSVEKTSGNVYFFFLKLTDARGQTLDARGNYKIVIFDRHLYLRFTSPEDENWLAVPDEPSHVFPLFQFLNVQSKFPLQEFETIRHAFKSIESEFITVQDALKKKYELRFFPIPILNVFPEDNRLNKSQRLEIDFDYTETLKTYADQHPDQDVFVVSKDDVFETQCVEILKHDPLLTPKMDFDPERRHVIHYYDFKENDWMKWLIERGSRYLEKGFKIYSAKWKRFIGNTRSAIHVSISHGIQWLEFQPQVHDPISGNDYDIDIEHTDIANHMVVDKKGNLYLVTPQEISKMENLYRFAEANGNRFRIPSRNYVLIRRLYDKRMDDIPAVKDVLAIDDKLRAFKAIADYPVSNHFRGKLRTYQHEGFKWLRFLNDYGFSGCLADDMGLGKTVQTLALLQTLTDEQKLNTSLLVVPVSAIPNWESELEKFAPRLTYQRHIGADRAKDTSDWKKQNLIITSYATLRNDIALFAGFEFDYLILDESQNIKNAASLVAKAVKVLKANHRLALSGTPIENNSLELWSLFDFLMPGFLGTRQWFNRQFAQAIERDRDEVKIELLKRMIFPFVLRRTKEEVEPELPEKIEIVSTLSMEDAQSAVYTETARYYREALDKEIEEKGVGGSSMKILEGILRLRQLCLFPHLANDTYRDIPSAKFNHLKGLLEDILAENHKVLIFSQFIEVLKVIKEHCDQEAITYSYIDGSADVNTRKRMIDEFQTNTHNRVFLLSLKTGGVALNLTAADYVILFDPWWNPSVEAQAIDRTHRIGQMKKVMVYRMVIKESIEEKILKLQEKKKDLVEHLISSDSHAFKNLKKEDIINLFH